MTLRLVSQRIYARSTRHAGECYAAVLDPAADSTALAYLRVDGTRESLICRPSPDADEIVLAEDTYVLSPHFAGPLLFWVQRVGGDWRLRGARTDRPTPAAADLLVRTAGRPRALASFATADGACLVWEERSGKRTRIRGALVRGDAVGEPFDVTAGAFNAYDPACCVAPDGRVHVIACAFLDGQYRIVVHVLDADGRAAAGPILVSGNPDACAYPSIWPRRDGGVWFSFTCFDVGGFSDWAFVRHHRYAAQHRIFRAQGTAYVGLLDDGKTAAVYAPPVPGQQQGHCAAMTVVGSTGAGHSHVFEDPAGRVHLLLRQHAPIDPVPFEQEDPPLRRPADRGRDTTTHNHPAISLMSLSDGAWSAPVRLIPRAHVEAPVSFALAGRRLRIAFTADARRTGWSGGAEWFDAEGELGVGAADVELPEPTPPRYELHAYVIGPVPAAPIANPPLDNRDGPYLHAIGQTHAHTNLSVCARETDRDPHINYRVMQDVQHSDFGATTDHAYNMWHTEMLITRKLAEYYYFPGRFVAIPAYEWTGSLETACGHEGGPWGHVNPLWLEEDGDLPFYTPVDPACDGGSLPRLWRACAGRRIVTPPHHVSDNMHPYYWDFFDPAFEPVVELFQDLRGAAEKPGAPGVTNWMHREGWRWAVDELKAGRRFGFIAGADHHGLARAGALVTELTRAALYEALMARRCFATTGAALRLALTCNDRMMGAEVPADEARFRLAAAAAEPIREIQIVRNGEEVRTVPAGACDLEHTWTATRRDDGEFWYCRVLLENGELAWTSPIWLTAPAAASPQRPVR